MTGGAGIGNGSGTDSGIGDGCVRIGAGRSAEVRDLRVGLPTSHLHRYWYRVDDVTGFYDVQLYGILDRYATHAG